ncbi:hypothetical protein FS837_003654 [Tulasnella sp. UAMH 9824]|nr:hypothetical protein FS837_003654 [Tulasnella sp. UAMH 9824]
MRDYLIYSRGYSLPILRREFKKRAEERKWRHYSQYPNGTLITGRLTESELAAAKQENQATARLSPSSKQGDTVPYLPSELVREIIWHATDTFPTPASIHYPRPSTRPSLLPLPPPHPRFPYSSHAFQEDRHIDRKLHALSMQIKLSASRVSRTWQNIAVEFLFNSIRIHNSMQIPLLWRAFEGDARRRGEQLSKGTIARPGSAPWWIRELWIDFEKMKHVVLPDSTETIVSFQLVELLKMCPNIVVFKGFGSWRQFQFPPLSRHTAVLTQVLGLPDAWTDKTYSDAHQSRVFEVPDTGRRIELSFAFEWETSFILYGNRPTPTPRILILPCISSLELRSLYLFMPTNLVTYNTIRLPNLVHLSLRGTDSLKYATTRLVAPSLRSVTLASDTPRPIRFQEESFSENFLEKHGLALEELTVLAKQYSGYLQRLDRLCPILHAFRTHYLDLPRSAVPSVRSIGLYGLEHAGRDSDSGESVISGILRLFPDVTTIQDLSWRSSVVRRRAFTNWIDPEGAKRRVFWTEVLHALRTGFDHPQAEGSNEQFSVREVTLLDWRGKPISAVPTEPSEDQCTMLGPDDWLLDALVSGARSLTGN